MKILLHVLLLGSCLSLSVSAADMAVLMPLEATKDPAWKKVGEAMLQKYPRETHALTYEEKISERIPELRKLRPRHLTLIAPPELITRNLVYDLHRLTRQLDDDPYGDCLWGIITGYAPDDAMRIVKETTPLILQRGLGTTGFDVSLFNSAMFVSDGKEGLFTRRLPGQDKNEDEVRTPDARGFAFEFKNFWDEEKPQFLVTSSHATQYNLEMPFSNGLIVSYDNKFHVLRRDQLPGFARFLSGVLFKGNESDLQHFLTRQAAPVLADSANEPKVWNGAGNCLLGDTAKSRNSMVVTALSTGGVRQLIGYTVTTWYGNMGWGSFGRFINSRGRNTFAESFFFTNQALLYDSIQRSPKMLDVEFNSDDINDALRDSRFNQALRATGMQVDKDVLGLIHDRDVVAFYGDPRWQARLDIQAHPPALQVQSRMIPNGIEFQITASEGYQGDGFDFFFPKVIPNPALKNADGIEALLTDDFVIVRKTPIQPGEKRRFQVLAGE